MNGACGSLITYGSLTWQQLKHILPTPRQSSLAQLQHAGLLYTQYRPYRTAKPSATAPSTNKRDARLLTSVILWQRRSWAAQAAVKQALIVESEVSRELKAKIKQKCQGVLLIDYSGGWQYSWKPWQAFNVWESRARNFREARLPFWPGVCGRVWSNCCRLRCCRNCIFSQVHLHHWAALAASTR